ncbi:hypothetical protein COS83_02610 [archaeon CG07_land_8_20_14_0_80_38_8]|nr:MAG: hypothetical protein COS83_02610 [archaeon CG07_land_8_20_14_0_80_38_8]
MKELKRQLWHALFGVIIAYFILNSSPILFQSVTITTLIALYYLRYLLQRKYRIPVVEELLSNIGRKNELGDGSFYFLFGALIASLFFQQEVAAVSVLVLGVSDAVATIIGFYFGKIKIYGKKTFEGTAAFFISCFIIVNYYYGFIPGLIASLILAPVELIGGFNDNIVIPPLCSLTIVLNNIIIG